VFEHRLGIERYHAMQLTTLGKGTTHALADLPDEEAFVLLMVRFLAARDVLRRQAQERSRTGQQDSWLESLSPDEEHR
jgi:hypothetical protein